MNKHKYIILETRVLYKLYDKKSLFVVQVGPQPKKINPVFIQINADKKRFFCFVKS